MATRQWLGSAFDIFQVDTITVANTWATSDSVIITVNGQDLSINPIGYSATADVADVIKRAINATSAADNLKTLETRNAGGQEIPEFTEFTATVSGSVVTVTGNLPGIPFVMTVVETTAGTGTSAEATATAATGRHFFDNVDNWSSATVPVTGDKLVFQNNTVDMLFNIDQGAAVTNCSLQSDATYTGRIGLKPFNDIGYSEYRKRHFDLGYASGNRTIVIGEGPGNGSRRINLDINVTDPEIYILGTDRPEDGARAAVDMLGGSDTVIHVRRGSFQLAGESINQASVSTLDITFDTNVIGDAQVFIGDNVVKCDTVTKSGGTLLFLNSSNSLVITTLTNTAGLTVVNGRAGCTTLNTEGGRVEWNSTGTIVTPHVRNNGVLDFSHNNSTKNITNPIEVYSEQAQVLDPNKVVTAGGGMIIDFNSQSNMSNLKIGNDIRITRGATA